MPPLPKIDKTKCTICGTCIEICPMEVFEMSETKVSEHAQKNQEIFSAPKNDNFSKTQEPKKNLDNDEKEIIIKDGKCIGCKACELQCEKGAITIKDE